MPRMESQRPAEPLILTTYVDEDTKNDLVTLAEKNERSVAAELRLAIRRHLEASKEPA